MTTIKRLALFAALPTLAHAGVVAHYSFDTDYSDSSGNDNHGTLVDVETLENSGITTTAGEFVFGGASMNFSADRDYVEIPSKTFGTGTAYTQMASDKGITSLQTITTGIILRSPLPPPEPTPSMSMAIKSQ